MNPKRKKRIKQIIKLKAVGLSQRQIAKNVGLSQSQVSRELKKIMKLYKQNRVHIDVRVRFS